MIDLGLHRLDTATKPTSSPPQWSQRMLCGWVAVGLLLAGMPALAQSPASPTPTSASAPAAETATADTSAPTTQTAPRTEASVATEQRAAPAPEKAAEESRAWASLSKRQQQALLPLNDKWDELTPQQKQKWLILARGFYQLSDPEQVVLHGRMREWAALSPRQRSLARFNFNTTQSLSIEDKRAQWEAYLRLSEAEKDKLSTGIKPPLKSGARSTVPPNKRLVKPPPVPAEGSRIFQTIAPRQPVHPKTLLPQAADAKPKPA
jgi:hypothetical protein